MPRKIALSRCNVKPIMNDSYIKMWSAAPHTNRLAVFGIGIIIYDLDKGDQVQFNPYCYHCYNDVLSLDWSPNGTFLAFGNTGDCARIHDLNGMQRFESNERKHGEVKKVRWDRESRKCIYFGDNGWLCLMDTTDCVDGEEPKKVQIVLPLSFLAKDISWTANRLKDMFALYEEQEELRIVLVQLDLDHAYWSRAVKLQRPIEQLQWSTCGKTLIFIQPSDRLFVPHKLVLWNVPDDMQATVYSHEIESETEPFQTVQCAPTGPGGNEEIDATIVVVMSEAVYLLRGELPSRLPPPPTPPPAETLNENCQVYTIHSPDRPQLTKHKKSLCFSADGTKMAVCNFNDIYVFTMKGDPKLWRHFAGDSTDIQRPIIKMSFIKKPNALLYECSTGKLFLLDLDHIPRLDHHNRQRNSARIRSKNEQESGGGCCGGGCGEQQQNMIKEEENGEGEEVKNKTDKKSSETVEENSKQKYQNDPNNSCQLKSSSPEVVSDTTTATTESSLIADGTNIGTPSSQLLMLSSSLSLESESQLPPQPSSSTLMPPPPPPPPPVLSDRLTDPNLTEMLPPPPPPPLSSSSTEEICNANNNNQATKRQQSEMASTSSSASTSSTASTSSSDKGTASSSNTNANRKNPSNNTKAKKRPRRRRRKWR